MPVDSADDDPPTQGGRWRLPLPADAGPTTRFGVSASIALDQLRPPDDCGDGRRPERRRRDSPTTASSSPGGTESTRGVGGPRHRRAHRRHRRESPATGQVSLARNPVTGHDWGRVSSMRAAWFATRHSEDEGEHFSLDTVSAAVTDAQQAVESAARLRETGCTWRIRRAPELRGGGLREYCHAQRSGTAHFHRRRGSGCLTARDWPFAMALDAAGDPGFAFFSDDTARPVTLSYATAGSTQTDRDEPMSPSTRPTKIPSVSLTVQRRCASRSLFTCCRRPIRTRQLWYAKKSSGRLVHAAGAASQRAQPGMLDGTRWYQAIVSEGPARSGHRGELPPRAGAPEQHVRRPQAGSIARRERRGPSATPPRAAARWCMRSTRAAVWVSIASHRPNKLTIALDYETNANPTIGGGVIVPYREP